MGKIDIPKAVAELDEELVIAGVKEQIAAGIPAVEILSELQQGMEQVGKLYESGEYYLSELIMSADVFATASAQLSEVLKSDGDTKSLGTIVLGTVKDDIHDIGKNIVATILNCNGFRVVDLGVDVPIDTFVAAVKEHNPQVVGMCCLLTTSFDIMKDTVAAVKDTASSAKVLVGGGPVDTNVAKYCNADDYCKSAYEAVEYTRKYCGVQ
ncbi:MAG: metH 6 [Firmicutes bacterium]|nr:metH 6 [Bacillota bacterium]